MERKAFGFEILGGESQVEVLLGEFEIEVCEHLDNIDDMPLQHAEGFAYSPIVLIHCNGSYVCWSDDCGVFFPDANKDGVRVVHDESNLLAMIGPEDKIFLFFGWGAGCIVDREDNDRLSFFSGTECQIGVERVKELVAAQ